MNLYPIILINSSNRPANNSWITVVLKTRSNSRKPSKRSNSKVLPRMVLALETMEFPRRRRLKSSMCRPRTAKASWAAISSFCRANGTRRRRRLPGVTAKPPGQGQPVILMRPRIPHPALLLISNRRPLLPVSSKRRPSSSKLPRRRPKPRPRKQWPMIKSSRINFSNPNNNNNNNTNSSNNPIPDTRPTQPRSQRTIESANTTLAAKVITYHMTVALAATQPQLAATTLFAIAIQQSQWRLLLRQNFNCK